MRNGKQLHRVRGSLSERSNISVYAGSLGFSVAGENKGKEQKQGGGFTIKTLNGRRGSQGSPPIKDRFPNLQELLRDTKS